MFGIQLILANHSSHCIIPNTYLGIGAPLVCPPLTLGILDLPDMLPVCPVFGKDPLVLKNM